MGPGEGATPEGVGQSEAILRAVAHAVRLLARAPSWGAVADDVLRGLGEAAGVSRAYLFANSTSPEGILLMSELNEWCAAGIEPTITDPENHDYPYENSFKRYIELLGTGEAVWGLTADFPEDERLDMESEGILATVFVPVFVGDDWWGFVGFDDCVHAREWTDLEVEALKAAAETLGAAIQRERIEAELRDKEWRFRSHLEHIPAITYIEYSDDDESLGYGEVYVSPQIENVLGYTQEQWMADHDGSWWYGIIDPRDAPNMDEQARLTSETGEPYRADYRILNAAGDWRWVRDESYLVEAEEPGQRSYWHGIITDITERKEMEERVRGAERDFRLLVEQLPSAVYRESFGEIKVNEFYISPQITRLLGYAPERFKDETFWESIIHPDDRKAIVSADHDSADNADPDEEAWDKDYRMIAADGRVIWMRDQAVLSRDSEGKPLYWQGTFTDITEEKHAEERLAEAEARFRQLVEQVPAVIYMDALDEEATTTYISPQIEDLLGIPPQEWMQGRLWFESIVEEEREAVWEQYEAGRASGGSWSMEYRAIARDGRRKWIREEAMVIKDADDEPKMVQGVMYDITEARESAEALREAETKYHSLVEQLPAVIYRENLDDPDEAAFYISPRVKTMLGFDPEQFMGDFWLDQVHPEDRDRVAAADQLTNESLEPWSAEFRMIAADGRVVWIRDEAHLVASGSARYWHGIWTDITEQKMAEEALREAETKYRAVIEQIPAITYLDPIDEESESMYVSPQVEALLGCTQEEWLGEANWWSAHLHPDDSERVWDTYERHRVSGEPMMHEYRMIRDDGRMVWIREEATLLLDDGKPWAIQGLMYDITERKEAEEQIAFLAYHDKLTGLANRAMLEEMLEPALARARRTNLSVALLFMDLDNFKQVNDTLGHQAGDELLVEVASRLTEATRDTDVVCRQGGDEFLVLLTDLEPGEEDEVVEGKDKAVQVAELMADRIHKSMRAPFVVGDAEVHSSASIGVSVFPVDAVDSRSLLKNADSAMYESKKSRPGGYKIHSQTSADPLTQLSFTRRLRKAVRDQNWVLHYQPVVALADGSITGVEALLRWRRPKGGLVPPGEFLPLAEEMGLMEIVGEWVIEDLARQSAAWSQLGIELITSFNLSPRQLFQRDLADKIMKSLSGAGVNPETVIAEISESTAMTDPQRTQRILWSLHERGLRVAVDDFGMGYSPPARLKHLPVDVLKVDQPLVRDLPDDVEVGAFVQAVIRFAADLGIGTQAVGIETLEQWEFLRKAGCELGQGYLFSRPVEAGEIEALVRKGRLGSE